MPREVRKKSRLQQESAINICQTFHIKFKRFRLVNMALIGESKSHANTST